VPPRWYDVVPVDFSFMVLSGTGQGEIDRLDAADRGVEIHVPMTTDSDEIEPPQTDEIRERVLGAAFRGFVGKGYAGVTMLEIGARVRVSKRDRHARFATKQAVLVGCFRRRAARMHARSDLSVPRDRTILAQILTAIASTIVTEVSDPTVVAMFQFAVAGAKRSPEVAQAPDVRGRETARQTFAGLFAKAQDQRLIGEGDAVEMAEQYIGLMWEGLQLGPIMGVATRPTPQEIQRRAEKATAVFLVLHPERRRISGQEIVLRQGRQLCEDR